MLLIYSAEGQSETYSEEEQKAMYKEYLAISDELREQGKMVSANRLQGTSAATTVAVRDDDTVVTDGPFAETKEALGGYYLVEAESLDEAIDWAARIPAARTGGGVEVRPIVMARVEVT
jgi:hypothetical protein